MLVHLYKDSGHGRKPIAFQESCSRLWEDRGIGIWISSMFCRCVLGGKDSVLPEKYAGGGIRGSWSHYATQISYLQRTLKIMIARSFGVSPVLLFGVFWAAGFVLIRQGHRLCFECVFDLQSGGLCVKSCPRYHGIL